MNDKTKGRFLVTLQFILLGLMFFWPADQGFGGNDFSLAAAGFALGMLGTVMLLLSFVSLGSSLTAMPTPKQNGLLVTSGIYKHIRHPIYTALILLGLAQVLISGPLPQAIFYILLLGLLVYKSRFEESLLRAKYPEYEEYAKRTGRFIPGLK
ncbi:MAG: methyltransferase family protein [Micrococcales bacterium]